MVPREILIHTAIELLYTQKAHLAPFTYSPPSSQMDIEIPCSLQIRTVESLDVFWLKTNELTTELYLSSYLGRTGGWTETLLKPAK